MPSSCPHSARGGRPASSVREAPESQPGKHQYLGLRSAITPLRARPVPPVRWFRPNEMDSSGAPPRTPQNCANATFPAPGPQFELPVMGRQSSPRLRPQRRKGRGVLGRHRPRICPLCIWKAPFEALALEFAVELARDSLVRFQARPVSGSSALIVAFGHFPRKSLGKSITLGISGAPGADGLEGSGS